MAARVFIWTSPRRGLGGGVGRRPRRVGVRRLVYGGAAIGGRDERPKFGLFAGGMPPRLLRGHLRRLARADRPDYRVAAMAGRSSLTMGSSSVPRMRQSSAGRMLRSAERIFSYGRLGSG